jgi:hypothetical protein
MTTLTHTPNRAATQVYSHRSLPLRETHPLLHQVLTDLCGCPVFAWIAARRYVYAFYGAKKIKRAAVFAAFLRECGIRFVFQRWDGGAVAVAFSL